MTDVAARIGNDVSYVTRIKHASHFPWQAQYLVKLKCHFSWQAQYLVKVKLFVAGAVLGEGQVSLFVAGAVLGEVQVSLCVVGAVLGEIWKDSRSAKCCIFQYKMLVRSAKSNLCYAAGCGLTETVSERARIILGSAAHWK